MTDSLPWYRDGLPFKCTGCGKCCTGEPGYVWIGEEEIEEMAKALGISTRNFKQLYTRDVCGELSLKEDPQSYDCVFLKDGKCQLYQARPKQCRTFPFWKDNLLNEEAWQETAKRCEGINDDAPLISLAEIKKNLQEIED